MSRSTVYKDILIVALFGLVYYLAFQISFLYPETNYVFSAVWPAGGIALAVLLLVRAGLRFPTVAVLFLAGNAANILAGQKLMASLGFMTANVVESFIGAWLITKLVGPRPKLNTVKQTLSFIVTAVFVSAFSALIGAATTVFTYGGSFYETWFAWWTANGMGLLLITPPLIVWGSDLRVIRTISLARMVELCAFLLIWCVVSWITFSEFKADSLLFPRPYHLALLLAWPALRIGQHGVSLSLFILGLIVITSQTVLIGPSPLGGENLSERLRLALEYLVVMAASGLLLASSIAQFLSAEQQSREEHARLRALGDNLPDGLVYQIIRESNDSRRFVHLSPGIAELFGVSVEQALEDWTTIYNLITDEDRSRVIEAEAVSARDLTRLDLNIRFTRSDGEMRWAHLMASPRRMGDGRIIWDGIHMDITEKTRSEEILEARLRLMEFANSHSLMELLRAVLDKAEALTNSSIGFIHFLGSDQKTLSLQAWSTNTENRMCHAEGFDRHYDISQAGVWVDCVYKRAPVIHNNYSMLPNRKGMPEGHPTLIREIVIPVLRKDKVVAILGVGNKPYDYKESDIEVVTLLADLAWDIAERKLVEESLLQTSQRLTRAQASAGVGVWDWDILAEKWYWSKELCELIGLDADSTKPGMDVLGNVLHPDDRENAYQRFLNSIQQHIPLDDEYRIVLPSGEIRWIQALGDTTYGEEGQGLQMSGISIDITQRKLMQVELERALTEKEALLRELYHRTKNNMQVISAFLELQADQYDDERIIEAFTETKNRIRSMALVHQKLYEAQDLSHVNLKDYITDLVNLLTGSFITKPETISFKSNLEDVFVVVDVAIPCGLILNELMTNALKYAFPSDRPGEITIDLRRLESGEIRLRVADNGVGVPPGFNFRKDSRLGVQTIFALGENQLRGHVEYETDSGVSCTVQFRDDTYKARV